MFEETYNSKTTNQTSPITTNKKTNANDNSNANANSTTKLTSLKGLRKGRRDAKFQSKITQQDNTEFDKCENCGNSDIVEYNGQNTCRDCGLIFGKHIDTGVEWRTCSNSNSSGGTDKIRTSINENKYIVGSTTTTTVGNNTSMKNVKNNNLIKTMSEWKQITYKDKSMKDKINNLTSICKNNEINDMMIEKICDIFFEICSITNPRRKKLIALMATSVMICYDEYNIVRSLDDLSQMFDIDEKTLIKLSKDFEIIWQEVKYTKENDTTELKNKSKKEYNEVHSIASTEKFSEKEIKENKKKQSQKNYKNILSEHTNTLLHYVRKLSIPSHYHSYFIELYTKIYNDRVLLEHIPRSKFAVIIHQGCIDNKININIADIVSICRTSDVTFNKCYKKFKAIYISDEDEE
jgi:transcription initiation factor TFIIIB Brf1 subunit/transcription initiation factor TFIIB